MPPEAQDALVRGARRGRARNCQRSCEASGPGRAHEKSCWEIGRTLRSL